MQAIQRFGILRGLVLAGWRLLRCNPWSRGGFDPVEEQRLFKSRAAGTDRLTMLVTANIFQPLIDVFEAVLKFFHNSVGIPLGLVDRAADRLRARGPDPADGQADPARCRGCSSSRRR